MCCSPEREKDRGRQPLESRLLRVSELKAEASIGRSHRRRSPPIGEVIAVARHFGAPITALLAHRDGFVVATGDGTVTFAPSELTTARTVPRPALHAWPTCSSRAASSCSRSMTPPRCRSAVRRCRCTSVSDCICRARARRGSGSDAGPVASHRSHRARDAGAHRGAGVAKAREIDVDTLDARLAAEGQASGGTCLWEIGLGAWARRPG